MKSWQIYSKDSLPKVQTNGKIALDSFADLCTTPEIKALAPSPPGSIADPSRVPEMLHLILSTSFGHYIQDNYYCLILSVLLTALQHHRSSDNEKSTINGYLQVLITALLDAITDGVPEVGSICAKVIGSLYGIINLENDPGYD